MSENKKIVISLPQNLLEEFDEIVECKSSRNRSKFIEEAVILYIKEQRSVKTNELMKRGYLEMAEINCEIAEFGISCDCQELLKYEAELAESDIIYGTGGEKRRYFYADLSPVIGSEQGGTRPVLIIQNDIGNKYSPTIIVAAITSQINKAKLPTHVEISYEDHGLNKDSVILLEQIRTIDKKRLKDKIGRISDELMEKVNQALMISIGTADIIQNYY